MLFVQLRTDRPACDLSGWLVVFSGSLLRRIASYLDNAELASGSRKCCIGASVITVDSSCRRTCFWRMPAAWVNHTQLHRFSYILSWVRIGGSVATLNFSTHAATRIICSACCALCEYRKLAQVPNMGLRVLSLSITVAMRFSCFLLHDPRYSQP